MKDDIQHYKKAVKYYDQVADRLTTAGHCLDVFACSLDQVGLAEMHPAVAASGGALCPCFECVYAAVYCQDDYERMHT